MIVFMPIEPPPMKKVERQPSLASNALSTVSAGESDNSVEELLEILVKLARDISVKPADRIAAINSALNRKLGTPVQQVTIRSNEGATLKDAMAFMQAYRSVEMIEGVCEEPKQGNDAVAETVIDW